MRSYFGGSTKSPFGGVTRPTTYGAVGPKGPDPRTGLQPGEKDTGQGPVSNPNDTFYFPSPGTAQPPPAQPPAQPPTQPATGTPILKKTDEPGTTGGGQVPTTQPVVDTSKTTFKPANPNWAGPTGETFGRQDTTIYPVKGTGGGGGGGGSSQPGNQDRVDTLWNYGQNAMNNPSRYDADLVKQGMKSIEDAIARMSKTGMRNISEQMAARGLTGSSLEGFAAADLQSELGRYGNERAFNLAQDQARTWAQDSSTAFGMGLGATGLGEQIDSRLASNRFQQQGLDLQGRGLDIQEKGQGMDEAYRRWAAEQGFGQQTRGYDQADRGYDQADLSMIGSLLERFGPTVVSGMGLGDFGSDWVYDEKTGKWRPKDYSKTQ